MSKRKKNKKKKKKKKQRQKTWVYCLFRNKNRKGGGGGLPTENNISHCNMLKKGLSPLVMKNQSQKRLVFSIYFCTSRKILTFIWYDIASSPNRSFLRFRFGISERQSNISRL